jgi:hypothetical protein
MHSKFLEDESFIYDKAPMIEASMLYVTVTNKEHMKFCMKQFCDETV